MDKGIPCGDGLPAGERKKEMIRNIILDIGNVLIPFTWKAHIDSFGFSEEIAERVGRAVFLDPDWNEIDRGVLTTEELIGCFIENDPSVEREIRMVMKDISGTVGAYPYTDSWIPQLQSMGYRVYLLSNFSAKQLSDSHAKLAFIDQADGAILSYRYQMIKPDDGIYQKLFEEYKLVPGECLFFDDKEENIQGAIRNGMKGAVFTGYEDAMKVIRSAGGVPEEIRR